ncbi:unnamed protein product [Ilex paraguariensis]|uniref:Uncharacterized protein n=1 Tax=Ilex paraguariensis TaxID=185542 RepID=A0ABC8RZW3_9AQUA
MITSSKILKVMHDDFQKWFNKFIEQNLRMKEGFNKVGEILREEKSKTSSAKARLATYCVEGDVQLRCQLPNINKEVLTCDLFKKELQEHELLKWESFKKLLQFGPIQFILYEVKFKSQLEARKLIDHITCYKAMEVERCRFCMGSGSVTVELGGGEKEVSRCINCDGVGSLTCTTCQGTGIQPRYLDRREFKDDD